MSDRTRISRRAFVRDVAVGAAGAALVASGAPLASAAGKILGEITLDGLMITYFGAPVSQNATATYMLGRAYDTTFALSSPAAPDLAIRASVPAAKARFFAGQPWTQIESTRMPGAITFAQNLKHGEHETISTLPPESPDRTVILSVLRPRLQIVGRPDRPRFRFVPGTSDESSYGITNVGALRTAPSDFGLTSATADSWIAQYVTEPGLLVAPRYQPSLSASDLNFGEAVLADGGPREPITASVSSAIVSSTFESDDLAGVFGVGQTLDVTYSSVQEDRDGVLITLDVKTEGGGGLQELYWDAVFKTFVIIPA